MELEKQQSQETELEKAKAKVKELEKDSIKSVNGIKSGSVMNELEAVDEGDESQSQLSEKDKERVYEISKQITPLDNEGLLVFGTEAQDNLTQFSDSMLSKVKKTDVGDIGTELDSLMKKLKMVDPEELTKKPNFVQKLFKKVQTRVEDMVSKHNSISDDVDKISGQLMTSKDALIKDVSMLDSLYHQNRDYFDEISVYIQAGELKMEDLQNNLMEDLKVKASQSNSQMDVQNVNDMQQYINRLEKRLYDLKLSRQIALQSAPQIRMVQDINQTLAEKIQSSVLTSIPLWKNQMAISLTLLRQESASKAQQSVTDTTNDLLVKNSELLKTNAISTAQENERGIVDIDTLKTTQNNLVETIEETMKVQQEGSEKRKQAEEELEQMEKDLKTRLLNVKNKYNK